jgi:hypothetical protein
VLGAARKLTPWAGPFKRGDPRNLPLFAPGARAGMLVARESGGGDQPFG